MKITFEITFEGKGPGIYAIIEVIEMTFVSEVTYNLRYTKNLNTPDVGFQYTVRTIAGKYAL